MATNYIQPGDALTIVATAAVASGDLVVAGSLIGVAATAAAIGAEFELQTTGVYSLPKVSADVVTVGAPLYYASATSNVTITPGTGAKKLVGAATAAAAGGTTTVRCKLGVHNIAGPA